MICVIQQGDLEYAIGVGEVGAPAHFELVRASVYVYSRGSRQCYVCPLLVRLRERVYVLAKHYTV